MYEAFEPTSDGEIYRFRSLDALARRLGGDAWHVVHDSASDPGPHRTVEITKWQPKANGHRIVALLRVPTEATEAEKVDDCN